MLKFSPFHDLVNNYEVLLFDLWGVIIEDDGPYLRVVEILNNLSTIKEIYFITNSSRPAEILVNVLKSYGIKTSSKQVITSGDRALSIIQTKYKKIFHLGLNTADQILSNHLNLICNDISEADLLLLSLYRDQGDNLSEYDEIFKKAIELKIPIICANPDYINISNGRSRYLPGYFAKILSDLGAEIVYTGKPYSIIYDYAIQTFKLNNKNKILMIGDTLETDILGATQAGIDSALVISGNSTKFYDVGDELNEICVKLNMQFNKTNIFPTFITKIE